MNRRILIVVFAGMFILAAQGLNAQVTGALEILTNIAKITAGNVVTFPTSKTNLTTATMYGASLYLLTPPIVDSVANLGRKRWVIALSNLGNASADFYVGTYASNVFYGGGTWFSHLSNGGNLTIGAGGVEYFALVISNVVPAANNSYMSFLVYASNRSAPSTYVAYLGYDTAGNQTVRYGGNLGRATNSGAYNLTRPIVFLSHAAQKSGHTNDAGYLTAIVSGPVLKISKRVINIEDPSGLYAGDFSRAVPGALITYGIYITNTGSAASTGTALIDTIALNHFEFVDKTNGTIFTNTANLQGNRVIFRPNLANEAFNAGANDFVRIRVRVK
jgi:uncharacterized repeat protein (TIGR01451 family)